MQEKTVKFKKIFSGRILEFKVLKVKLPSGKTTNREIVYHPGAAAIVPVLTRDRIILVKQYRKAVEKSLLEIPAGTLEKGENPLRCAQRELVEETGYKAKKIIKLLEFYPAPGYSSEKIYIFKATGLQKTKTNMEPDEFIKTVIATKDQIRKLYKNGGIKDSKTLIGLSLIKLI